MVRSAATKKVPAKKRKTYRQEDPNGVISANEAYTFRELFKRFGFGSKWTRKARENGLKTVAIGRQRGVIGATLIDYLKTQES